MKCFLVFLHFSVIIKKKCIYEIFFGIPPFFCDNQEKMYQLITKAELRFPKKIIISDNAKDLLQKILIKDQDERLGSKSGFNEIKAHPFFKGFDFDALEHRKLELILML